TAREIGPRLRRADQALAGARRQPELQIRPLAGARDERLGVVEQRVRYVYRAHRMLHARHRRGVQRRLDLRQQLAALAAAQQLALVCAVRVAEGDAHQEAVELRLGQAEGAELLVRVLRGDHEEHIRQRIGGAVGAHLPLLHGLEQRALGARTGAVHLVGEQQLREDWAVAEIKALAGAIEHRDADDVGGQQVAGELHALPGEPEHVGEGVRERRLADTRHVLDQQVAARQQAGEAQPDLPGLAEDDGLEQDERPCQAGGIVRRADVVHAGSSLCTRSSCARSPLTVCSRSAARARSAATTAAGAWSTKPACASRARTLSSSRSALPMSLPRRSASAGASMSPAIGTSSVSVPTSALAEGGAGAPAASVWSSARPASRSSEARWRAAYCASCSLAPCSSSGMRRAGLMFISPRIWRTARITARIHAASRSAASSGG